MALVLHVDATLLQLQVNAALTVTATELERALPIEVNNSGHRLFFDLVNAIAAEFPEVPTQAIAAAMTSREGSTELPSFVISAADNMVTYVEWVTSRDERVCKICGPRDGVIYRIIDVMDIYPAHPNCRCRLARLGIANAMAKAGAELMPEAMDRVVEGLYEQFGRVWERFDQ